MAGLIIFLDLNIDPKYIVHMHDIVSLLQFFLFLPNYNFGFAWVDIEIYVLE